MADLEDDMDEQANDGATERMQKDKDLFGEESDDEEDYNPEAEGEEAVERADEAEEQDPGLDDADLGDAPEAAAEPAAAKPVDRRAALAELAQKHKQRGDAADGAADKPSKKDKRDKGDKSAKKHKRDKEDKPRSSSKRRRDKAASPGSEDEYQPEGGEDAEAEAADPDRREAAETRRDMNFIDDDGAEPAPPEVDEDQQGHISEAEEANENDNDDDIDRLMKPKKKKKKEEEGQVMHAVESFCAKMEVAAEEDMRQQTLRQPAINKLRMLKEVREFLSQKKVHELFLSHGGMGVLKAWLEPYEDGALPNVTVRKLILTICQELPIDTAREDMKDRLKRSELGSRVMFLYKCPAESPANKQLARELVEKWSRPIFMDPDAEAEKRHFKTTQAQDLRRHQAEARLEAEAKARDEAKKRMTIKPGEAGYRIHAALPQASKLDYVVEPRRDGADNAPMMEVRASRGAGAASNAKDTAFHKKMREVQRKQKMTSARALKPSVEGRGMVL